MVAQALSRRVAIRGANRYELMRTGSGTTVTKTVIWPPLPGVNALGRSAVFALYVNGAMRKGLAMLKQKAEARS
jgi:hypothetical protein